MFSVSIITIMCYFAVFSMYSLDKLPCILSLCVFRNIFRTMGPRRVFEDLFSPEKNHGFESANYKMRLMNKKSMPLQKISLQLVREEIAVRVKCHYI